MSQVILDPEVCVTSVKILYGGPYGLERAVADALGQWAFRPVLVEGRPRAVYLDLTSNFMVQ